MKEIKKIKLALQFAAKDPEQMYWCRTCSDCFSDPVRHCDYCDHHYQDTECGNCYERMPKTKAVKVTAAVLRELESRAKYLQRQEDDIREVVRLLDELDASIQAGELTPSQRAAYLIKKRELVGSARARARLA